MNNIMIVGEHTQYNTTIQDYGKLSHLYDILCLHSFFFCFNTQHSICVHCLWLIKKNIQDNAITE